MVTEKKILAADGDPEQSQYFTNCPLYYVLTYPKDFMKIHWVLFSEWC